MFLGASSVKLFYFTRLAKKQLLKPAKRDLML